MAATPRDAATIILVRPVPGGGYEVLLTRRPETMKFMGGMYVFPGGALDEADRMPAIESLSTLTPTEAVERIGEDVDAATALGLYCCAVRELFEEVGILLARDGDGRPVDPDTVALQYAPVARRVARDANHFADFLAAEGLRMATDLLVWHGRLVTPEVSPIRFDARFFVAPWPEGQRLTVDETEVTDVAWISPAEAIRRAGEGTLAVPIPTMAILQGLSEVPAYTQLPQGKRVVREIHVAKLSPLVTQVLAPNPGLMTGPGTNTYVIGTDETVIVDPAVPDGIYIEALTRAASTAGRPVLVLLTHMHPDHTGGATVLAEQAGIEVAAWKGVDDPMVTRKLDDGDVIEIAGARLRVLYTPGHASHHLCFLLEGEGSLFAGDVVAGLGTVVIAPPDGDMGDYLATLERLSGLGVGRIYPGHGPTVSDGPAKLAEYTAHRRDRERQVVEAMRSGSATIPEIVKAVYVDVPEVLHPAAEMSVLAHLEMLETGGRARRDGDAWTLLS